MEQTATASPQILLKRAALLLFGLAFLANALFMLAAPQSWYQTIEGVPNTGPYNVHFVRDIGMAYLTQAVLLFWAAWRIERAFPLVLAVALFLGLHALLHFWDIAEERLPVSHLLIDLPGVFLPAVLALGLAFWCRRAQE